MVRLPLADVVAALHRSGLDGKRGHVETDDHFPLHINAVGFRHDGRCRLAFHFIDPRRLGFGGKLDSNDLSVIADADEDITAFGIGERHKCDNGILIERHLELDGL